MSAPLDLHHFESLIAVVEAGSVTEAAEQLWVTQSALSHRLAEAERRLGAPLLEKRGRTARPTTAALALYQAARRALPELRRAEADFVRLAGQDLQVVRIGVLSYDCYHWLSGFHDHATEYLPGVVLELVVPSDVPAAALAQGKIDVILSPAHARGRVQRRPLFADELVLCTHPEHPLAARTQVSPADLEDATYLSWSRTTAPGFEYERFFRPAGVAPRLVQVVEHTGAIAEMVQSGLGVSILSRWALSPWIARGAVAAIRCGRKGLPLPWSSLLRPEAKPEDASSRVAASLASWLSAE